MKLFRIIKNDLSIIIKNKGFWISVIVTLLLCFTTTLYTDSLNKQYSVIEVLLSFDKQFILSDISYSSLNVMLISRASKLFMFIPIVATFSFVQGVCDEKKSRFKRSVILRSGKIKYHIGKLISSIISGGLVISLGYLLFCICIYFLFPSINEYGKEIADTNISELLLYNKAIVTYFYNAIGSIGIILLAFIGMFLYGAFATLPTLLLLSITNDKYFLTCLPFIFKYSFDMWSNKVFLSTISGGNLSTINKWIIENCRLENLYNVFSLDGKLESIIFYLTSLMIISIIYLVVVNRRVDYGE